MYGGGDALSWTPSEVRKPMAEEMRELTDWCMREYEVTDFRSIPAPEYVAVFPNYMTDCPGYAGKVLVVVWGGGPGFVQSFVWLEGKIQVAENEFVQKGGKR